MTMLRQLRRRLQMKSKIALFFMILISFLLQCTLLHVISIGSITPNLILILCISMGLMRGRKSGLWTGFFWISGRHVLWLCVWFLRSDLYVYWLFKRICPQDLL